MEEASPEHILQFVLSEKLGESTVGEVYQAWDTTMERIVALRLIPSELNSNRTFRTQCLSTLRGVAGIAHPNIGGVFGATEENEKLVVVLEYIPCTTLKEILSSGSFDNAKFLNIAIPIVRGLNHAHERGIVHGNLRPSNIVIAEDGVVKLMDFGLSLHLVEQDISSIETDLRAVRYRSIEHILGRDITPLSDLFSVGAIFWELLSGKSAFAGNSAQEIEDAILQSQLDFTQLRTEYNLPGDTILMLKNLLAKNPEDRFSSTSELLITLEEMQSFEEGNSTRQFFQVRPSTPRQYLLLSLLAVLMVIFWLVITTVD
ncbi:MAG: serine/threonine-protein kinase [candidate division Zixibacteria bacterium]|nr:serine/threonine-protein kinase [candidate division Zixibacteria bacterium]